MSAAREFYASLGIELPEGRPNVSVRCFANPEAHRHHDRHPSASVNVETGAFCCHACDAKGGPYDAAVARGRTPAEATELLERAGLKQPTEFRPTRQAPRLSASGADLARWHEALIGDERLLRRLFELRGWTPDAARTLGLGFDGERVVLPIRDAGGQLVNALRYLPNPELRNGKLKMLAAKGCRRELFPAPESLPANGEQLLLVEGEPDAVSALSVGLSAVAIPGVQGWRSEWAQRFAGRRVCVTFDCDRQGREAAQRVAADLAGVAAEVRVLDVDPARDDGFDLGDFLADVQTEDDLKTARTDIRGAGEDAPLFLSSPKESIREETNGSLPFAPISEALANVPDEPEWLWRGYVAPGAITLLAGLPKAGKTTLAFAWLEALIAGKPFLDLPTRKAGVLLLSEERETTLKEKWRRFGLDDSAHLLMRHQVGSDADWGQVVDQAVAHCHAHELGVLCVDTWDKWSGLKADHENSTGYVVEALRPLMDAAGAGLAVVVLTHQRKGGGRYGEGVKGSNALVGGVDVVIEIERTGPDSVSEARVLRAESRYAVTPDEVAARLTDEGYEACGTTATLQAESDKERLRAAGRSFGDSAPVKDYADAADLTEGMARKRLGELSDAGEFERTGAGGKADPYRWQILSSPADSLGKEPNELIESGELRALEDDRLVRVASGNAPIGDATLPPPESGGPTAPSEEADAPIATAAEQAEVERMERKFPNGCPP